MSDNNYLERLQELGNSERLKLDTLLAEERQRYDDLNGKHITLRVANAELQDENNEFNEQIMRLNDANENLREDISQLQEELNVVTATRNHVTDSYKRLKQKHNQKIQQLEEVKLDSDNNWLIMAEDINEIFEKLSENNVMKVSLKKELDHIMDNIHIDCVQMLCYKWYDSPATKDKNEADEVNSPDEFEDDAAAAHKKAKTMIGKPATKDKNEEDEVDSPDEFEDDAAAAHKKAKTMIGTPATKDKNEEDEVNSPEY